MAVDLKVFISWSGDPSRKIALVWRELLAELFDTVTPFVSDADIEAGARGLEDIKDELAGTRFAIVVVTRDNQNAPWLNFEAGAISKQLDGVANRVAPCLVDFDSPNEVTSPIKQFQACLLNEDGVTRILASIATAADIDWAQKSSLAKKILPGFLTLFSQVQASTPKADTPRRTSPEMVEEVLTLVREIHRESLDSARFAPTPPMPAGSVDDNMHLGSLVLQGLIHDLGAAGEESSKVRSYNGILIAELRGYEEIALASLVQKIRKITLFTQVREVIESDQAVARIAVHVRPSWGQSAPVLRLASNGEPLLRDGVMDRWPHARTLPVFPHSRSFGSTSAVRPRDKTPEPSDISDGAEAVL